jgi:DNA-directed RNA polymerase specialized sigma24 family protein
MTEVLLHGPIETITQTLPLFEEIYRKHFRDIVGYLYKRIGNYQLAEDLAHDVFLKLYDKYTNA